METRDGGDSSIVSFCQRYFNGFTIVFSVIYISSKILHGSLGNIILDIEVMMFAKEAYCS